jgi:Tol biopolymer transport system component
MTAKPHHDILEWTITHAPDPSEAETLSLPAPEFAPEAHAESAPASGHHLQVSRRIWAMLGMVIVGSLLGAGLFTLWNQYRIRGEVEKLVIAEEQAALAGDRDEIEALTDPGDRAWLAGRLRMAEMFMAAPSPLPLLSAVPEPGRVQSVHSVASNTVRVDVAHRFIAPGGGAVTFVLPQFYRYADGKWLRIAPPTGFWGEKKTRPGLRVNVDYYPVDEEFAAELGDYLDAVLAQACALWPCPDDLRLHVELADRATDLEPDYYYYPFSRGSLLVALMDQAPTSILYGSNVVIASPHAAGYAADSSGADLIRHVAGIQVLAKAGYQIAPDGGNNAFLHALVARMAARLGVESPKLAELYFAGPRLTPEALLGSGPSSYSGGEMLVGALAVLNRLLKDQPAETEARLFQTVNAVTDPVAWLAEGMRISPGEARSRLRAALEEPYPVELLTADPHEFILTCPDGPMVFSRGDAAPTPLLSGFFPFAFPAAWSPDGRKLALYVSGQWAVLDFESREFIWPPREAASGSYNFMGWASDTVVVYQTWPQDNNAPQSALHFFDTANPQRDFPALPAIRQYLLSPNKSRAAVVLPDERQDLWERGHLALMPALGGALTPLDDSATDPVWSPDGRALAYTRHASNTRSLYLADPTTMITREVWSSSSLGIDVAPDYGHITWAPDGKQIALTETIFPQDSSANTYSPYTAVRGWVGLLRPAERGAGLRVLADETWSGPVYGSGFSADGKYLAVVRFSPPNWTQPALLIFDVETGELKRTLQNRIVWWSALWSWSPTGHAMVVSTYDGVYLLNEPGDENSQPEKLTGAQCYGVQWNPGK